VVQRFSRDFRPRRAVVPDNVTMSGKSRQSKILAPEADAHDDAAHAAPAVDRRRPRIIGIIAFPYRLLLEGFWRLVEAPIALRAPGEALIFVVAFSLPLFFWVGTTEIRFDRLIGRIFTAGIVLSFVLAIAINMPDFIRLLRKVLGLSSNEGRRLDSERLARVAREGAAGMIPERRRSRVGGLIVQIEECSDMLLETGEIVLRNAHPYLAYEISSVVACLSALRDSAKQDDEDWIASDRSVEWIGNAVRSLAAVKNSNQSLRRQAARARIIYCVNLPLSSASARNFAAALAATRIKRLADLFSDRLESAHASSGEPHA